MTKEEACAVLDDMKVKIDIPKSAVTQHKRNEALDMAISALSADVRPNIHGEWIFYDEEFYQQGRFAGTHHRIRECSFCHHKIVDFVGNMNFCPNCGADMRGET